MIRVLGARPRRLAQVGRRLLAGMLASDKAVLGRQLRTRLQNDRECLQDMRQRRKSTPAIRR